MLAKHLPEHMKNLVDVAATNIINAIVSTIPLGKGKSHRQYMIKTIFPKYKPPDEIVPVPDGKGGWTKWRITY